jgi:hypothetical protein
MIFHLFHTEINKPQGYYWNGGRSQLILLRRRVPAIEEKFPNFSFNWPDETHGAGI